jgi:uncharacterized protein (DUF2235 family)
MTTTRIAPGRVIVCADGTWNTPDETSGGVATPTNVVKMFRALTSTQQSTDAVHLKVGASADGKAQLAYYHEGVGTGNIVDHLAGALFGDGIDRNIQDCYAWLVDQYVAGDEIFLFGFSRGAYTARSLAGLIRKCGLLTPANAGMVGNAYDFYRDRSPSTAPSQPAAVQWRAQYSREVTVTFIGVWDTVGSLGIPIHILQFLDGDKYQFHDVALSSTVKYGYQALGIDEERVPFEPCVWAQSPTPGQTMSQVWFCGTHSNIGGGYPDVGISDLTFDWMRQRAAAAGLGFDPAYLATVKPDGADGKVYDSMAAMYKIYGRYIRVIREKRLDSDGRPFDTMESLHTSALNRWVTDSAYADEARNVTDYVDVNPTDVAGNVTT